MFVNHILDFVKPRHDPNKHTSVGLNTSQLAENLAAQSHPKQRNDDVFIEWIVEVKHFWTMGVVGKHIELVSTNLICLGTA